MNTITSSSIKKMFEQLTSWVKSYVAANSLSSSGSISVDGNLQYEGVTYICSPQPGNTAVGDYIKVLSIKIGASVNMPMAVILSGRYWSDITTFVITYGSGRARSITGNSTPILWDKGSLGDDPVLLVRSSDSSPYTHDLYVKCGRASDKITVHSIWGINSATITSCDEWVSADEMESIKESAVSYYSATFPSTESSSSSTSSTSVDLSWKSLGSSTGYDVIDLDSSATINEIAVKVTASDISMVLNIPFIALSDEDQVFNLTSTTDPSSITSGITASVVASQQHIQLTEVVDGMGDEVSSEWTVYYR